MIDYDKLEIVHGLYPQGYLKIIPMFGSSGELTEIHYSMDIENIIPDYFSNIDDLIVKLQEIVRQEPKYKVGQLLWFIDMPHSKREPIFKIMQLECKSIDIDEDAIRYVFHDDYCWEIKEEDVYPSREDLIEAQIAYWTCLKNQESSTGSEDISMTPTYEGEIKGFNHNEDNLEKFPKFQGAIVGFAPCNHESDGYLYPHNEIPLFPAMNKCKKCGDFYR